MEHTKGKLTQGKSNTLLYINGINFGDVLVGGFPHEVCEANAKEVTRRWNAFENSGIVPKNDLLTLGLLQEKNKNKNLEVACKLAQHELLKITTDSYALAAITQALK